MRILIASPEAVPYIKTDGLADVAGALSKEYRKMNEKVCLVLPLYKKIRDSQLRLADTGILMKIPVGDRVIKGRILKDHHTAYFIECDEFFDRPELYATAEGDYNDNASRFAFFSKSILVDFFISSCFVHLRKPDADIFRVALDIAQVPANQLVYIENTPMLVQIAEGLGIQSILHSNYRSTSAKLASFGLPNDEGVIHETR